MRNRREFLISSSATAFAGMVGLSACSGSDSDYANILKEMTQPLSQQPEVTDLIRYATLAANGHNTQPWKFKINDSSVDIRPDLSRRTAVVDPDDHHLFASLGCAAENMSIAARARSLSGDVNFSADNQGQLTVTLHNSSSTQDKLLKAIPVRQCTRAEYDGKAVSADDLKILRETASSYGVEALVITSKEEKEAVLDLVIAGNSSQMNDPAFVKELKDWIRFNESEAVATKDGIYSASSGNPSLPGWIAPFMFDLFFSKNAENDKYAKHIRSSSGLIVFVADQNNKEGWCNAGRACQRFALQATALGLKHAFVNQTVEVPEMRRQLQTLLKLGDKRPNLVVRFGYGPSMPKSLRRPVKDVLVS